MVFIKPHTFTNSKAIISPKKSDPIVFVSPQAIAEMQKYVDICEDEIGWLGFVRKHETKEFDYYVIESTLLFGQEVHGATTEISPESLGEIANDIIQEDQENGVDKVNRLRMWGHSHVNMEVSPSGQDNSQMEKFKENNVPYFIRIITNKKGKMRLDLFDYENGIIYNDMPWNIYCGLSDERNKEIEIDYKAKVKKKTVTVVPNAGGMFNKNFHDHYNKGTQMGFYSGYGDDEDYKSPLGVGGHSVTQVSKKARVFADGKSLENLSDLHRVVKNSKEVILEVI